MELKTFNEIINNVAVTGIASIFAELLKVHGEVMVRQASGLEHSIHLGDKGELTTDYISYRDKEGSYHVLCCLQIERMYTHKGYPE